MEGGEVGEHRGSVGDRIDRVWGRLKRWRCGGHLEIRGGSGRVDGADGDCNDRLKPRLQQANSRGVVTPAVVGVEGFGWGRG
jgi:hypothetical protein